MDTYNEQKDLDAVTAAIATALANLKKALAEGKLTPRGARALDLVKQEAEDFGKFL